MTERRPHWTDDLIEAVFRIMDDYAAEVWRREHDHGTPTFNIIAAVEDWQKRQDIGGDWGTVAWSVRMYQHYVTSEAAIQRVRELHQPHRCRMSTRHTVCRPMHGGGCASVGKCDVCRTEYPCATIRALDVNTLLSKRMEQVERAEKAEAARDRLANQLLNEVPDSYIQMKARALDAEAAIQRVREVCDLWQRRHDASIRHPSDIPAVAIIAVLRALGPVTETDCHGVDA